MSSKFLQYAHWDVLIFGFLVFVLLKFFGRRIRYMHHATYWMLHHFIHRIIKETHWTDIVPERALIELMALRREMMGLLVADSWISMECIGCCTVSFMGFPERITVKCFFGSCARSSTRSAWDGCNICIGVPIPIIGVRLVSDFLYKSVWWVICSDTWFDRAQDLLKIGIGFLIPIFVMSYLFGYCARTDTESA